MTTLNQAKPQSTRNLEPKKEKTEYNSGLALDPFEYELRRVLPPRLPLRPNDVYITKRTKFPAQLAKCTKLLELGQPEIFIHGLGAAINRAINLALQIKRNYAGSLDLATSTSTVKVTDRLLPLVDDLPPKSHVRQLSAIHIKVFRPQIAVDI